MSKDDTPRLMTREEAAALDQELLDCHPHLARPTVQPVYRAVVTDHYQNLVREKGSHEAAHQDLRVRRYDHFNEVEKKVMQTIWAAARIKDGRDSEGHSNFVEEIQREQYVRGLYSRPEWMSNEEAREIERDRRGRGSGVMRVSG